MKFLKLLLLFFTLTLALYFSAGLIRAEESSESTEQLQNEINGYVVKLDQLGKQKSTLKNEIAIMDSQIQLTSLKIQQTLGSINLLEEQIKELGVKIGELDQSLDSLSLIFLNRVSESYKSQTTSPFSLFLSANSFGDFYRKLKYLKALQLNDRVVMIRLEEARFSFDRQKQEREEKQAELESLKKTLNAQKESLEGQKVSKKRLLVVTQNDEQKYQKLLTQARTELNSLRSFALSRGGGLLPPQSSPDGWYYNQRDERWGGALIGSSDMTVWEVGCLITSVAMLYTKNGFSTTPLEIASNVSFFFSDTAYMLRPWPTPSGLSLVFGSYDDRFNFIDQELSQDRSVIIHLNIGGDGHFVVVKRKDGSEYIINDPWYGPDLKLTDYYSISSIDQAVVYR